MTNRFFFGMLLLLGISQITRAEPVAIEELEITKSIDPVQNPTSFLQTFYRFVQVFIALLSNEKVVNGITAIEKMIESLIQTAYQAIYFNQISPQAPQEEITKRLLLMDPRLQGAMVRTIITHAQHYTVSGKRKPSRPRDDDDETTQRVLIGFGGIVQNFLAIVQDPENPENVTPNLINMLANIIGIGVEVTKRPALPWNADNNTIAQYVIAGISPQLKYDMLATLPMTLKRTDIESTPV